MGFSAKNSQLSEDQEGDAWPDTGHDYGVIMRERHKKTAYPNRFKKLRVALLAKTMSCNATAQ